MNNETENVERSSYENHVTDELALFRIDGALFGIDIVHIKEINKNLSYTKVTVSKDYIKGVLNLRGQIVTVIDLRLKFRKPPTDATDPNRRMIIVNYHDENVGLLVDSIDDIIHIDPSRLENSATRMQRVNPNYFSGVYKLDSEIVIILDVVEILDDNEDQLKKAV